MESFINDTLDDHQFTPVENGDITDFFSLVQATQEVPSLSFNDHLLPQEEDFVVREGAVNPVNIPSIESLPQGGGNGVAAAGGNTTAAQAPRVERTDLPVRRVNQSKSWCFTAYPQGGKTAEEWGDHIYKVISPRCVRVAMQIEKCPETDKIHIQGCLEGSNRLRWSEFKLDKSIHWEQCKGTWAENFQYCSKEETRAGKQWFKGCLPTQQVRVLADSQLRNWQIALLDVMATVADDRTIHWIWSQRGGVGKSSFAKYCAVKVPGTMVANGKAADILNQVVMYKESFGNFPTTIIMNLPRCTEGHVSYTALEQLKDGLAMSSKYEGGQIIMNPAHVFVFANQEPEWRKMSDDRFKVVCLDIFVHD